MFYRWKEQEELRKRHTYADHQLMEGKGLTRKKEPKEETETMNFEIEIHYPIMLQVEGSSTSILLRIEEFQLSYQRTFFRQGEMGVQYYLPR